MELYFKEKLADISGVISFSQQHLQLIQYTTPEAQCVAREN